MGIWVVKPFALESNKKSKQGLPRDSAGVYTVQCVNNREPFLTAGNQPLITAATGENRLTRAPGHIVT
jgi:hypothetical protein